MDARVDARARPVGPVSGVLLRLRADLRRNWTRRLATALVIGLGVGLVGAVAAGSRRTTGAYDRFESATNPSDALVATSSAFGTTGAVDPEAVRALPVVEDLVPVTAWFFAARPPGGERFGGGRTILLGDERGRWGSELDRTRILQGRRADPSRVDEVVVGFSLAQDLGLRVGDDIEVRLIDAAQVPALLTSFVSALPPRLAGADHSSALDPLFASDDVGPRLSVEVVGVEAAPHEFPPQSGAVASPIHVTPAFDAAFHGTTFSSEYLAVDLRPGASTDDLLKAIVALPNGDQASVISTRSRQGGVVQRSFRLDGVAFALLAVVLGITVAVAVTQAVRRLALELDDDAAVLSALGMTRSQQVISGALTTLIVGIGAAVFATVLAIALSPVWPLGLPRIAETRPGIAVDVLILVAMIGCCIVVVPLLFHATTTRGVRAPRTSGGRDLRSASWLMHHGWPLSVVTGVRFAFGGRSGRDRLDARSAITGLTAAVAGVAVIASFASGLFRLTDEPRNYGWAWDLQIGIDGLPDFGELLGDGLAGNPDLSAVSIGTIVSARVDGALVSTLAVDPVRGAIEPALVEGAAAGADDEIVLGPLTLEQLGRTIGDQVSLDLGGPPVAMRVVGAAIFPDIGDGGRLGTGAWIRYSTLTNSVAGAPRNVAIVDVRDGGDPDEVGADLRRAIEPLPVRTADRPDDLLSFTTSVGLGLFVVIVMGLVLTALSLHALTGTIRRRTRELGVLKCLGFMRWQVAASVYWQATAMSTVALMVGVPLGTILGRRGWTLFAERLGTDPAPVTSAGVLAVVASVVFGLVALAAVLPGLAAARAKAVTTVRAE